MASMVSMNGTYRDANTKLPVRILCTDRAVLGDTDYYPVVFLHQDGRMGYCKADGTLYCGSAYIEEEKPYDDFADGEAVYAVFTKGGERHRRYFAGVGPDGVPLTYPRGTTKWSSMGHQLEDWTHIEKVTHGEEDN